MPQNLTSSTNDATPVKRISDCPLRSSCILKMGTMKARAEVRRDRDSFACNVRHGAPSSYHVNRYALIF